MNCSTHPEREAAFYCKACEKFLCDQCKTTHNAVYEGEHELSPVEPVAPAKPSEVNVCHDHSENPLDMFCNDCHDLCCFKCEFDGKHKGHCVSKIKSSEKNFMSILDTCISEFESQLSGFNETYNSLCDDISVCKNQAKSAGEAIKEAFGKLRKAIDAREAALLEEVEKEAAKYNTESKLLSEAKSISDSKPIERAHAILDNWKNVDSIVSIRAVLAAEAEVKKLKEFKALSRSHKEETVLTFENAELSDGISASVSSFGKLIVMKRERRPHNVVVHHVGAFSAVLSWDKNSVFGKYCVLRRKKSEKEFEKEPVWEGYKNSCIVYRLSPNSEYDFCVKGLCGEMWSVESESVHVVSTDSTVKELSDLKNKVDNRVACAKVFRFIIGHTTDADRETTAKNEGAIELVIRGVEKYIGNPDMCKLGCESLKAVTIRTGDKEGIAGVSGAIDLIVKIMCMYLSNEEVCGACFEALGVVIKDNITSQEIAGKAGAIDAIINMMNSHIENASLCEQGCSSLQVITSNPKNQQYAGKPNVIEKIITVLNKHIKNASICESSCATLKNIMINR